MPLVLITYRHLCAVGCDSRTNTQTDRQTRKLQSNYWTSRVHAQQVNKSDFKMSKKPAGLLHYRVTIHVVALPTGGLMHSSWLCESTESWSSLAGHRVLQHERNF